MTVGWGGALIVAACICWGIDNNLTQKLSAADPVQIAMVKGVAAGVINTALGFAHGAQLPEEGPLPRPLSSVSSDGVSLVLFVLGLRHLGAARTGAYFSIAPFIGAAIAVPLLGEPITWSLIGAAGLMAAGVYLHLAQKHDHEHVLSRAPASVSSISFGGFPTVLPDVRAFVVTVHDWITDQDLTNIFAMAQAIPGPNMILMMGLIGWKVSGLAGALAASTATFAPPCAIYFAGFRLMRRF